MKTFSKNILLGAIACFSMGSAYALPLGNPADPALYTRGIFFDDCCDPCDPCGGWFDAISFRIGYYGDFIFNQHMERDSGGFSGDIENTEIYTNAGLFVVNFCDRVDVFAALGATQAYVSSQSDNPLAITSTFITRPRFEVDLGTNFSWSVGARAVLWECGCTSFGIEGQYFHTHLDVKRVTAASLVSEYPSGVEAKYHEWQVGVGIAHRIHFLVPYLGVKWSRAEADLGGAVVLGNLLPDLKSKKHWGFVAGVTLLDCDVAGITVEGRWGDEKALHVNGQVRF